VGGWICFEHQTDVSDSAVLAPGRKQQAKVRTVGVAIIIDVSTIGTPGGEQEPQIGTVNGPVVIEIFGTWISVNRLAIDEQGALPFVAFNRRPDSNQECLSL
jgi:hypothetical protein